MKFVLWCILLSYFYKNVLPAAARSTFLKTDAKQNAFKNVSFESLLPFQSPSAGPSSATKNRKKCCSREGLEHFFDLRPFFNHNLQFMFAISVTCFKKFDLGCLFACFSSFFCEFYGNVLPAFGGKHISEEQFLQISCARGCFHTQVGFKPTTYGRAFPPCAVQIIVCFAEWAENGPLSKLCLASLLLSHAF